MHLDSVWTRTFFSFPAENKFIFRRLVTDNMWFILIATIVIGALLYKLLWTGKKDFWKKYGIRQIDTSPAIGPLDILLGRKSLSDADDYVYSQMGSTEKFCGILESGYPMLIVKDMEIMKKILIKDFDHFVDRRQFFTKDDGNLALMLTNLQGDEWKGVRASVSPTFTTGKIRRMMEYFNSIGLEWVEEFKRRAKSDPSGSLTIDVIKSVNQYTVEVISSTVFGMSAGTIKNPQSTFAVMANRVSDFSGTWNMIKFAIRMRFRYLSGKLGIQAVDTEALRFFERILEQGLRSRLSGETKRNDFLQLMVEAQKGELKAVGNDELSTFEKDAQISVNDKKQQYLSEDMINAQSVIFLFAGFTTTSNLLAFILYALALHPVVQDKLRKEVVKIVKNDGGFDYDDIGQLVYLDMVMNETLRKFPGVGRLERMCVQEYRDPETGLVVPKGTVVVIPANSIHHSKEFYDNPDQFDPEHFSPEKKAARNPYAFMPFGIGPRNCIGMRFAQTEVKTAIAHIVHSFLIEPTSKTPVPLQGKPVVFNLVTPTDLDLKLTPVGKN